VVQDVEIPLDRAAEFVGWFLREVPIAPVWLCPLRLRGSGQGSAGGPWPLYPLRPEQTYLNVGFWSTVPILPEGRDGDVNRRIEGVVADLDGHKSLYSDSYYPPEEFWDLYGGAEYRAVKARYDPGSRLLDLYAKAVGRR
jgi:FAD/FMN-containing dehydrogenase